MDKLIFNALDEDNRRKWLIFHEEQESIMKEVRYREIIYQHKLKKIQKAHNLFKQNKYREALQIYLTALHDHWYRFAPFLVKQTKFKREIIKCITMRYLM